MNNFKTKLKKRIGLVKSGVGFTLIELLIVIAVIGVLAMGIISIVNPVAQFQKAKDANRKSDLSQIQKSFETYYQDNGRYPSATLDDKIKGLDNEAVVWGSSWQPYMSVLPKDPASSKSYAYRSSDFDGQSYYLYASLDRGANDSQACHQDGSRCNNAREGACGSGICNYGVSSPNVSP